MIVAFTGHRPEDSEPEATVRDKVRRTLEQRRPEVVISGMAAGFDLWAADEALGLGIEVVAARPWSTHAPRRNDVELYAKVINHAVTVVSVTETSTYPGPWVYHKRNEWMVDNADEVLAYWSGKKSGGTFACVNYANKKMKKVTNVY